jgi:hypothetical protein
LRMFFFPFFFCENHMVRRHFLDFPIFFHNDDKSGGRLGGWWPGYRGVVKVMGRLTDRYKDKIHGYHWFGTLV